MAVANSKSKKSSSSKYVDFDEFIGYQLKKTRAGIHHTDIITSAVVLAAVLLGYLLVFTICDHWLIAGGFNDVTRTILFGIVASFTVGWLFLKIAMPLYREVNILYAAREIEETYPELKDSLLSWVQLREEGREIPPDILNALEKRTALQIKKSDVDLAVDRRFLMRSSYVLLGIVVAMCLYTLFSPKNISNSVWRALLPASNVSASTKTVILEVVPGDYEVLAHDQLDVTVDLDGVIPDEVKLLYSTTDNRFVDEPLSMRNTGEGLPRFRTRLSGVNGQGLLKDFTYRIEAGDAVSDTYFVKIKQPPSATVTEIHYDYPDYMLLDDKTQRSSTIDAWEGVYVTVRAQTNMPVKSASLFRSDNDVAEETADVIPMVKVGPDEVEARWRLKFREDGTFANYYFIQVENFAGEIDPLPTIHRIKIRPDLHPEVSILFPTENMDVPANAVIPVAYEANDPDFLLRRILLKMERQGELLPTVPRLFEGPEVARKQGKFQLDLKPMALKPGDQLQFYLEAEDNFEPFDQLPKHVSRTSKFTLNIVEPVKQEEAEEFANQQEEQLRNQIAEDQQPNAGQRPKDGERPKQQDPNAEDDPRKQPQDNADFQPTDEGETPESENPEPDGSQQSDTGKSKMRGSQDSESQSDQSPADQTANRDNAGTKEEANTTSSETEENSESDPSNKTESSTNQEGENSNLSDEGQNAGESSQSKNGTSRQRSADSKAEDDEALKELLEWSKDKPEPEKLADDEPAEEQANPENTSRENFESSESSTSQNNSGSSGSQSRADQNGTTSDSSKSESSTDDQTQEMSDERENQTTSSNDNMNSRSPSNSEMTEPSAGEPSAGEPSAGEPSAGEPSAGEPSAGEPSAGEPSAGEPSAGEPSAGEPSAGEPSAGEPSAGEPSAGEPSAGEPSAGEPSAGEPSAGEPSAGEPSAGEPSAGEPSAGEPSAGKPSAGEPSAGEPSTGEPSTGEPSTGEPSTGEPSTGEPSTGEPSTGEPSTGEPSTGEPSTGEPSTGEPSTGEPSTGEPSTGEPSTGEPSTGEPSTGEPSTGEPSTGEPSTGEPSAGEPTSDMKNSGEGKAGEGKAGEGKAGEGKAGEGKAGEGKAGEGKAGEGKAGEGQPGGEQPGQGNRPGQKSGPGGPGGKPNQNAGEGTDSGESVPLTPEEANLENKKKAVDLALKKLKDQIERGEAPEELMEQLGFSDQDLSSFMQRLEERLADPGINQTRDAEAARRQFDQLLKGIDYNSTGERRDGGNRPRQSATGFGGANRSVPPEYRMENEAYKRRLSRQGSGE